MRRLWLVVVVIVALAMQGAAPRVVRIVQAPSFVWNDDVVTMQIRVEPRAVNRLLVVSAVQDGVEIRRSREQLDGASAARTRWIRWGSLTAGEVTLVAAVYGSDGSVERDTRPMLVTARF